MSPCRYLLMTLLLALPAGLTGPTHGHAQDPSSLFVLPNASAAPIALYAGLEVDLDFTGPTTLLAFSNPSEEEVWLRLDTYGAMGWAGPLPYRAVPPRGVATLNLRDDLRQDRPHLCPQAGSDPFGDEAATVVMDVVRQGLEDGDGTFRGSLRARSVAPGDCQAIGPDDVITTDALLLGDTFRVDAHNAFASGGVVATDPPQLGPGFQAGPHEVRFALGNPFSSTRLELHIPGLEAGTPRRVLLDAFSEAGERLGLSINFVGGLIVDRPFSTFEVEDLGPFRRDGELEPFGRLVLTLEDDEPLHVQAHYRAAGLYSVSLPGRPIPAIHPEAEP